MLYKEEIEIRSQIITQSWYDLVWLFISAVMLNKNLVKELKNTVTELWNNMVLTKTGHCWSSSWSVGTKGQLSYCSFIDFKKAFCTILRAKFWERMEYHHAWKWQWLRYIRKFDGGWRQMRALVKSSWEQCEWSKDLLYYLFYFVHVLTN